VSEKAVKDKRQLTFFFTSWVSLVIPSWALLRSFADARKCQHEDFCEKERYESCPVRRTCTADAFRKVRKGENLPVLKLLPGSHERLAFEKPTRSVPETWGANARCTSPKKLVSSDFAKILEVATKIRETCEKTLFTPSSPLKATI
jgi:hypothetical protein